MLVQNIGLVTIAALIGGGGFGIFVFQGIGQTAMDLVLLGAVPTVALAFAAAVLLDAAVDLSRRRAARMIEIEGLTKRYDAHDGGRRRVDGGPERLDRVIVGTSGSGKSTVLRMINRLVEPTAGRVLIDGEDTTAVPGHELRRQIGYAIQGHGLFPHRTVAENIATVPRLLGWASGAHRRARRGTARRSSSSTRPSSRASTRTSSPAASSSASAWRGRWPPSPNMLLMDEPFGALDADHPRQGAGRSPGDPAPFGPRSSSSPTTWRRRSISATGSPSWSQGRLVQYAEPAELVAHPADEFVARLTGTADRAFRLLSLTTAGEAAEPGPAEGAPIAAPTSACATPWPNWSGPARTPCRWSTADGARIGRVTMAGDRRARPAAVRAHLPLLLRLAGLALLVAFLVDAGELRADLRAADREQCAADLHPEQPAQPDLGPSANRVRGGRRQHRGGGRPGHLRHPARPEPSSCRCRARSSTSARPFRRWRCWRWPCRWSASARRRP